MLQALMAAPRIGREASALRARRGVVVLGALAVGAYPLAFYSSMQLAGVAVGTVVSIGSAPLASAVIERVVDGRRLTRRWTLGAGLGLSGTVLLCMAEAARSHSAAGSQSARTTVLPSRTRRSCPRARPNQRSRPERSGPGGSDPAKVRDLSPAARRLRGGASPLVQGRVMRVDDGEVVLVPPVQLGEAGVVGAHLPRVVRHQRLHGVKGARYGGVSVERSAVVEGVADVQDPAGSAVHLRCAPPLCTATQAWPRVCPGSEISGQRTARARSARFFMMAPSRGRRRLDGPSPTPFGGS